VGFARLQVYGDVPFGEEAGWLEFNQKYLVYADVQLLCAAVKLFNCSGSIVEKRADFGGERAEQRARRSRPNLAPDGSFLLL
jgi:hypothetical protein